MKPLPNDIRCANPFAAFLDDVAALGVRPVDEGGRCYVVIAARSNLRWWLLPMDSRRAATAGMEMLQPVSWVARVAKTTALALARYGPQGFLGSGQLRLSALPDLGSPFGGRTAHVAYFTGTEGPHRKTTLQAMDVDGAILGYAKLSRAAYVRPYLHHEADILAFVERLNLTSVDVPSVQALRDEKEFTLLITDSMKSTAHTVPTQPGTEHLRFLKELCAKTVRHGARETINFLIRSLPAFESIGGREWANRISRALVALRPFEAEIPVCLVHGDFTPWNTFLQNGRLYVFDWEYANETWPVGFDLAHFYLSTTPLEAQPASLPKLTRALADAHFGDDSPQAARALLLCLACHAVFYLRRLEEASRSLNAWVEGPVRAEMIDRLLTNEATVAT